MRWDYWGECVKEAFEDAGINATQDQINTVVCWVEGAHENHGTATGADIAHRNFVSDEVRELKRLKSEQEKQRLWVLSTYPCKTCTTTGLVKDGWGRDVTCPDCDGSGRNKHR